MLVDVAYLPLYDTLILYMVKSIHSSNLRTTFFDTCNTRNTLPKTAQERLIAVSEFNVQISIEL